MNRTIYKYRLDNVRRQVLELPRGHEVLKVDEQDGTLVLWALVDVDEPKERVVLWIFGTGFCVPESLVLYHLGTVQMGQFVWHVFEDITEEYNYIESK